MKLDCAQCRLWIEAHVDRELDPVHSLELAAHGRECRECRSRIEARQLLREAFRSQRAALSFALPENLSQKLAPLPAVKDAQMLKKPFVAVTMWAVVATLALFIVLPASFLARQNASDDQLVEEVVSSHVRSLMGDHLTDVLSSDRHTVKPWFSGKLDYAPSVQDFADRGYPLIGGRLDYLAGRPVASLIYRSDKHSINLYLWPSTQKDSVPRLSLVRGYNLYHWVSGGMTYWAVSDVNAVALQNFISLVK